MGQEFIINSQALEDKINQLLPSQGGKGAGIDLSASTTVIPIIDLTESAEGSNLRQDLQTAISHGSADPFSVVNTTTTIINTTGYYRVFGAATVNAFNAGGHEAIFQLTDGFTNKIIWQVLDPSISNEGIIALNFDFIVFLAAGDSLSASSSTTESFIIGSTRQIADINGNLVNPV